MGAAQRAIPQAFVIHSTALSAMAGPVPLLELGSADSGSLSAASYAASTCLRVPLEATLSSSRANNVARRDYVRTSRVNTGILASLQTHIRGRAATNKAFTLTSDQGGYGPAVNTG